MILFESILKHHLKLWAVANIVDIDRDQYICLTPLARSRNFTSTKKHPHHSSSRTNATIITTDDEALRRRKEKLVMSQSNDDEVPI